MPDSLKNLMDLTGKTAMVTGGCQTFGLEIATGLAELGADLVVTSRQAEKAEATAAELASRHRVRCVGVAMDILSESSVQAAFASALESFPRIDILVNNAGGHSSGATGGIEDESLACFSRYIDGNLTSVFLTMREFVRQWPGGTGASIINIASVCASVGRDRSVYQGTDMTPSPIGYAAAKAGVLGLTYDGAAILAPQGIRVNAVSPGGFERNHPESFVQAYSSHTMLKRMGRDGLDLKGAVAFLASDAAAYITAHNMLLDGGFTRYS